MVLKIEIKNKNENFIKISHSNITQHPPFIIEQKHKNQTCPLPHKNLPNNSPLPTIKKPKQFPPFGIIHTIKSTKIQMLI